MDSSSVYRLQLTPSFTFYDALAIVPYLHKLGVEGVYTSPFFEARPGSSHGYDNTSSLKIREELGGEEGFLLFSDALLASGMSLLIDIVSNHMATSEYNEWWMDVLTYGKKSRYAHFFDIDWKRSEKIYLPILEGTLVDEVEKGSISLVTSEKGMCIEAGWQRFPVTPGTEEGDLLTVLGKQHYTLEHWEGVASSVNYRRFFDINELIALRMEDQDVFDAFHPKIFQLIEEGRVQGVRIDHPDGLLDPKEYFDRLRACNVPFIIVEKILERGEQLRSDWAVDGSVGYDFLTALSELFIDSRYEEEFTHCYETFIQRKVDPHQMAIEQKRSFALIYMRSELESLSNDIESLADFLAAFPVYRTYVRADDKEISPEDREWIDEALEEWLLPENRERWLKFQQLCAPIMAKGVEDTHLYVYNRFVAQNEVGGDPHTFGISTHEFHALQRERKGLLPVSTHDTKRSMDMRMRLCSISEMPRRWAELITKLEKILPPFDTNTLYFFFQTVIGVWEEGGDRAIFIQRVVDYMIKAAREGKVHTNWIHNNTNFERSLATYVREALANEMFVQAIAPFVKEARRLGRLKSYSGLVVQLGSVGIVDVYQGNEVWDYSLVDPDNRRPVDFEKRNHMLHKVRHFLDIESLLEDDPEGELKLFLLHKALLARKSHKELFTKGEYTPLKTSDNTIAFMVSYQGKGAVTFAKRLQLCDATMEITLPKSMELEDIFTGERYEGDVIQKPTLPFGILLNK